MRILVSENPNVDDIDIVVNCRQIDERVIDIVSRLRIVEHMLTGSADGQIYTLPAQDALYLESVDKHTFIYAKDKVLECKMRLFEMEEQLASCGFMRISKSCIVNFRKISALRPELNGRLIATLSNGEKVMVSRKYAADIKRRLGIA